MDLVTRKWLDTVLSAESLGRGYFQPTFVRRLAADHLSGRRDHTLRLWQLVVFEKWHQQYVDTAHGTGQSPSTSR